MKVIKFTKDVMHQEVLLQLLKTEEVLVGLQQLRICCCCERVKRVCILLLFIYELARNLRQMIMPLGFNSKMVKFLLGNYYTQL